MFFGLKKKKPTILLAISESLSKSKGWHAGNIVKAMAPMIDGGGGAKLFCNCRWYQF